MARRPFDPAEQGWKKTEYRQGDVTDAASVRELVKGADVVVHLAFAILSASDATRELNVDGLAARVRGGGEGRRRAHLLRVERRRLRLPRRQPGLAHRGRSRRAARPSTPTRSRRPRWSACSARCCCGSRARWPTRSGPASSPARRRARCSRRSPTTASARRCPTRCARLLGSLPVLKPVIPDPGIRFQLVHEDDVASAFAAGVRGLGEPGPYNLAGSGTLTMSRRGRRARLVLGAGAEAARGRHRRGGHAAAAHARHGGLDPLGARSRC